ncbi:DMT family transporter [Paenibacillus shunpengii]|uniref:DMT family transporter n=1 Tax=Paenibacillus shunpengii TaxID=2054424 RepID=A0ABW5SMJ6_9BACL
MCLILIILGALFWGIGGTVAKKLFQYGIDMGSFVTVRLLIAGILLLTVHCCKKDSRNIFEIFDRSKTMAFWFYIESLNSLSPKESSLMGSLEPIAAVLTTVFWMKESFGGFQWMGTLCIMIVVIYLALNKEASSDRANS